GQAPSMEVGADERARDRRRALQHPTDETDQRSKDARAQRRGVFAEETVTAREEDDHHDRDQQRERPLIEARQQQCPDRGADRRRHEERRDAEKQVALAVALDQEQRVRGEDGVDNEPYGDRWAEP